MIANRIHPALDHHDLRLARALKRTVLFRMRVAANPVVTFR
ncbi:MULTISPECIES: hypothetical protein [Rhizobium/Agrobacterium group]|nr:MULTISPECIES: hypothetical protein [Rhizobium/Agrobacterium group]